MIARTWHGRVPAQKAEAYASFLSEVAMPDYRGTPGFRGVFVLRREEEGVSHFVLISLWDSLESIRTFAGPDPLRARYYPEDPAFLLEMEPNVTHHEVRLGPGGLPESHGEGR